MPVAVALGRGPARWVEACGGASLAAQDTAILGYRDKEESLELRDAAAGGARPD